MEEENRYGRRESSMKATGKTTRWRVAEGCSIRTETFMKASERKGEDTDRVLSSSLMGHSTEAVGSTTSNMDTALKTSQMARFIKGNLNWDKKVELGNLTLKEEIDMKDNLKMER